MRAFAFGIVSLQLLLALRLAPVAAAGAPDPWMTRLRASRAAMARGDLAEARTQAVIVDSIAGGHPGSMAMLARIAARRGERSEALRWLTDLAATGLTAHLPADSTFAAFAGDPRFQAIAARMDSNGTPIARATVAVRLSDPGLLAEDVAWDATGRRFLVSAIHRGAIVALDSAGRERPFFQGGDGVWGVYALAVDAAHDVVWATTAAGPEFERYTQADSGRAALIAIDRRTGRLKLRLELPRDGARHVLGDQAIGPDGAVYITDSVAGGVFRLRPGSATLDTLAPAGTFASPQQPALTADGRRLLIPDYPRGIAALDVTGAGLRWLAKPRTLACGGIDGLCRDGDRLIAIQNGTSPRRVLELRLDATSERIVAWRVLEQASPALGEPNHGIIVGRDLVFIGNSGWDRVNDRGELDAPEGAVAPVLLRLRLDDRH